MHRFDLHLVGHEDAGAVTRPTPPTPTPHDEVSERGALLCAALLVSTLYGFLAGAALTALVAWLW